MAYPTVSTEEVDKLLAWRLALWKRTYGNTPTPAMLVKSINDMMAMDEPNDRYNQFRKFRSMRQDQRLTHAIKVMK